ncbi:MAG: MarR family transcriptional regulator, partial [Chloroflexota bacterium]
REKIGRDNRIYLTKAGWDLFGSIMPAHDDYVREILSPLSKKEIQQFSATLRKINRALDK